jgi:hypothetical protein
MALDVVEILVYLLCTAAVTTEGVQPQFSWDTLPVFFHSSNASGLYSAEAVNTIAKYSMVTIEKWQSFDVKTIDDEDAMVLAMKAVKDINPKVATYFYMNSFKDRPEMTRMARQLSQHPTWYLVDSNGTRVKNGQGYYAFDMSNPEVRNWWKTTCLNATKYANGDGCFCDSSQHIDSQGFKPRLSPQKEKAFGEGILALTKEVQEALGNDKLLIGKVPNQPYVKAVQIEFFVPSNKSITELLGGAGSGQVIQAHKGLSMKPSGCTGDLTDVIAAFLIAASENCYFGCGDWNTSGNNTDPLTWRKEYDMPLGAPLAPATYSNGMWSRQFKHGTKVTFDTSTNKGTIVWGKQRD